MHKIPIAILICFIPLIITFTFLPIPQFLDKGWPGKEIIDMFSYSKSLWIIGVSCFMVVLLPSLIKKSRALEKNLFKFTKFEWWIFAGLGVYFLGSFLSFAFSNFPQLAFWGAPGRNEGLVILLCYGLIFTYVLLLFKSKEDFTFLVRCFFLLGALMVVVGVIQAFTDFPSRFPGYVNLTLGNPNYTGSYTSIFIPFFIALAFGTYEKKSQKFMYAFMAIAMVLILIGSKSQAGIVGSFLGIIFLLVVFWKKLIAYWRFFASAFSIALLLFLGLNFALDNRVFASVADIFVEGLSIFSPKEIPDNYGLSVYALEVDNTHAKVSTIYGEINISLDEKGNLRFVSSKGEAIDFYHLEVMGMYVLEFPFSRILIRDYREYPERGKAISIGSGDPPMFYLEIQEDLTFREIDPKFYDANYVVAPSIGFKGNEKLGSSRGYIWSRSLPLAFSNMILGNGPDTYLMYFPNDDHMMKAYALYNPYIVVDKPHSIYLLTWINSGGIALLGFLVAVIAYIFRSFRLYSSKKDYSLVEIYAIAGASGVVGYLGSGFFNDSVVSVAPLFWIIFAFGVLINLFHDFYIRG